MRTDKPTGTPFSPSSLDPIADWSRQVFEAFAGWAAAHSEPIGVERYRAASRLFSLAA